MFYSLLLSHKQNLLQAGAFRETAPLVEIEKELQRRATILAISPQEVASRPAQLRETLKRVSQIYLGRYDTTQGEAHEEAHRYYQRVQVLFNTVTTGNGYSLTPHGG
jgi:hypothetical protein